MANRVYQLLKNQFPQFPVKKSPTHHTPATVIETQTTQASPEINLEYTQMLRGVIDHLHHNKQSTTTTNPEYQSQIAQLISNEALQELEQIQDQIKNLSQDEAGSKKYINLDDHADLADKIETWIKTHLCSDFPKADFEGEKESDANTIMGEAWFGFESLIDLQNAESIGIEIESVISKENYFKRNYLEKKQLKSNLEQKLINEFRLESDHAQELVEISLIYRPLDDEINKFLQNQKFEDQDWIKQEQLRTEFLKQASNKYPVDSSKIKDFFDLKVKIKEGKGTWATLKDLNERLQILKDHKLLAGSRLGLTLTGDAFIIAAPVLMSAQKDLGLGFTYFFASTLGGILSKQASQLCFDRLANLLEKKLNREINQAHHFRQYEDTSRNIMGQILEASNTGKEAVRRILENSTELPSLMIQPLASAALLMYINPYLGLTSLAGIGAIGGSMFAQGVLSGRKQRENLIVSEEAAKKLDQSMKAIQEIRLSPNIADLAQSLLLRQDAGANARASINYLNEFFGMGQASTSLLSSIGTAMLGAYLGIPETDLISIFMYNGRIMQPVTSGIAKINDTITQRVPAVNRLFQIIGNPNEIVLPDSEVEKSRVGISDLDGYTIEIENLSFLNILNGVNLTINQGEFVTITGPSGIGKSTLLKNILGLRQPSSGSVLIGGTKTENIKKYDRKESLNNLVAYADQKPQVIIGETLRDNLLLGLDNVSDERIQEVMIQLGLYKEDIEPGTNKSDPTVVNFALDDIVDHDLSGGQKVRIGLARALLRNAQIIVLDEPTASLDAHAAKEVRQLLIKLHRDKPSTTIVCVTHDDHLIEDSKRIGRTYSLNKEVNNIDTVEGLKELILQVQPEQPEDIQKFLTEDLYRLTGVDMYDLRRVLIPHSNQEGVIYSNLIWDNQA